MKKEIINKWEKIGFLDGLNDIQKINISEAFEFCEEYFLFFSFIEKYLDIESIIFPIIRRVLTPIENKLSEKIIKIKISELIEDLVKQGVRKQTEEFTKLNIDVEAEWCAAYSNNYKLNL